MQIIRFIQDLEFTNNQQIIFNKNWLIKDKKEIFINVFNSYFPEFNNLENLLENFTILKQTFITQKNIIVHSLNHQENAILKDYIFNIQKYS